MKSSPPCSCICVAKAWERNGWLTALLFLGDHFSGRWHLCFQKHRKKVLLPKLISLEVWRCGADHWPHWTAGPFPPGQWQRAKAQSPGARRRRPFSVASHEQLQPAFPQERDLTPHHHTNSRRLRPVPGAKGQNTLEVSLLLNTVLTSHNQTSLTKGLTHPCSKVLLLCGS